METFTLNIIWPWVYFGVIFMILVIIMAFCFSEVALAFNYIKTKKQNKKFPLPATPEIKEFPFVTIQIPIFNEKYVAERVIRSAITVDYPKDKLQIQVLDDSTDETVAISEKIVNELSKEGFDIILLHRKNREGFKAGALRDAMPNCKGEFVAIFDADFIIQPNFLKETIPYFINPKVGMVQTRWGHLNEKYSLLTKIQSFFIDIHFSVQHTGRSAYNYFINFNGTAGIWRKSCIEDAGGWTPDTLTEDLDLSYRAQLKGWKFKYKEGVISPAELPAHMAGIKSQQFRWIKGGTQVGIKLFKALGSSNASFKQKWFGYTHIFAGSTYLLSFMLFVLSVPLIYIFKFTPIGVFIPYMSLFMLSTIAVMFTGGISFYNTEHEVKHKFLSLIFRFSTFLLFTMGLSLNNTIATIEGITGKKSDFIRTPKFNLSNQKTNNQWSKFSYISKGLGGQVIMEILLLLYFIFGIGLGIYYQFYHLIPLHLMLAIGYGMIVYYSIKHAIIEK
ncbi:MAG: glycosyltransferase family 2 protein [Chitinophagales bacterium]